MTTMQSAESTVAVSTASPDLRGFWRVLLAVIAPLPWLAKAIDYAFMPRADDSTAAAMKAYTTNHAYTTLRWFDTLFVLLLVPAAFTAAWVARRGAPRLATVGALMTVVGFLAGISRNINGDQIAYVAAQKHLDPAVITTLVDALEADPTAGLGSLLFILGLVFGSLVLGAALWRSGAVPGWVGLAVAIGGCTHPFLSFDNVVVAAGLVLLAAGFAGVSVALLHLRDDDFDLPPTAATPRRVPGDDGYGPELRAKVSAHV